MTSPQTRAFAYSIIVSLGGLVFGLDLGVIAGTFDYIKKQFELSDLQIGNVGAAPGFGAIFALFFTGAICNRLGRKRTIQLIALLYLASAVTSALAPGYWTLFSARFLGGLAFCSLALASMYIGEIAPAKLRGRFVAVNQFNIILGLTLAYYLNYLIGLAAKSDSTLLEPLNLSSTAWRWMLGTEVPFALAWLLLLALIPESPRWLMMVGREERAREAMSKLLPADQVEAEIDSIRDSITGASQERSFREQAAELISRRARGAFLIGLVIAAVQPITGINAINTYAPLIFAQAGAADPLKQTLLFGLVGLVATIAAFVLVDRVGRRPLVIWGLLACFATLGLCAWGFHNARYKFDEPGLVSVGEELAEESGELTSETQDKLALLRGEIGVEHASDIAFMTRMKELLGEDFATANKSLLIRESVDINASLILFGVVGFMAAFQLSIGPIMWVVLSEIFSTRTRGVAIPAAQLMTAVVNYFVQLLFPWQLANMGARDIFLFYSVCVVLGMAALAAMLPETKNKSIEQIAAELGGEA